MEFEFLGLGLVRMLSTNEEKKEKRKKRLAHVTYL